jgi:hypothetical protein
MLDSHPRISCGPETKFLFDFADLSERVSLYGFPDEYWNRKVAEFFDSFQTDYARGRDKVRWAAKTPRYALLLDYIDDLFPTCQIIHVIRDGRDVVASHRHRWGRLSGIKAVVKWPHYIHTVRQFAQGLPRDRYYEVRYEELVTNTEKTMRSLLDFLGEPWDDAVLAYDKAPHDVNKKYAAFTRSRREASNGEALVYQSRVGGHKNEMGTLVQALFRIRGTRTLRKLGYAKRHASSSDQT